MGNWSTLCVELSELFNDNAHINFNVRLTPEQVSDYLESLIACRVAHKDGKLEAAIFVSKNGECGFVSTSKPSYTSARYLIREMRFIIHTFPCDVRKNVWCRIQKNNKDVVNLARRTGFEVDHESNTAIFMKQGVSHGRSITD